MKFEVAMAWAADLRNPENKQIKDALFNGVGYCCLGRLCIIAGKSFHKAGYHYQIDGEHLYLPNSVKDWAGLSSNEGYLIDIDGSMDTTTIGNNLATLAGANDGNYTFAQIADIIEQNWEKL